MDAKMEKKMIVTGIISNVLGLAFGILMVVYGFIFKYGSDLFGYRNNLYYKQYGADFYTDLYTSISELYNEVNDMSYNIFQFFNLIIVFMIASGILIMYHNIRKLIITPSLKTLKNISTSADELYQLQKLLTDNLITQEEYEKKRKILVDKL